MPKPNKKPAAKKKPAPATKSRAKGPAKVLQHPSSLAPSRSPSPTTSPGSASPSAPKPKKEPKDWKDFHGLTTVDFPDLIERRQTVYRKLAELEMKLKGRKDKKAKDYEETRKASLDGQIKALLDKAGVHDNTLIVDERLVSTYTGHSPKFINQDKLLIALMDHLDPEVIEEVIDAATEGGDAYTALRITDPKE